MKVLMISSDPLLLDPQSGVARRMEEYGSIVDELHIIVRTHTPQKNVTEHIGTNVWVYPTRSLTRLRSIFDVIKIGRSLASKRFSLITAQDPFELGFAALRISATTHVPVELQVHTDILSPFFTRGNFLNTVRMFGLGRRLRRATRIRVVSARIQESLVRQFALPKEKIAVLPVFVDPVRFAHLAPELFVRPSFLPATARMVLMVDRLTSEKNVARGITVFGNVAPLFPDVHLVIVGDGPLFSQLKQQATHTSVGNRIHFVGHENDIRPYLAHADIFLHTALYEGYGMALIEAGRAGTAIITTDVGIAGSVLKDGESARICPVEGSPELQVALDQLLQNNAGRLALAGAAHQSISAHLVSREAYLGTLQSLWEQVSAKK